VTTIYPFKAVIVELVPEAMHVVNLVPSYASPHTFELLPADLRATERAKILIYGGVGLDNWAQRISVSRKISLIQMIPDSLLIHMHNHEHDSINPHFWTDPLLIKTIIAAITDTLCTIFPLMADSIMVRSNKFILDLNQLHSVLESLLVPLKGKFVATSHPFFDYFLSRYNIYSLISLEEIPGKEPTPRTIQKIIQTITDKKVSFILTHRQLNDQSALMISEYTGIPVVELDPLGSESEQIGYSDLLQEDAKRLIRAIR
jgi:zinc transport system substrate-binding protein